METLSLGLSKQEVSAICLGTMYFGSSVDEETSIRLLDVYTDVGGSFLDTANAYARWVPGCNAGESETVLANWFKMRGNRHEIFLATKVGFPAPVDGIEFGQSAAQIEQACEASLKRMGTDYIDLYYSHADDRGHPMEERLEALSRLVKAGKVRFIGASNFMDWRLEEAKWLSSINDWPEYCCIQQRYTYVRPQAGAVYDPHVVVNDELLDYCKNRNLRILAYSPLMSGAYVRDDRRFPDEYYGPDLETRLGMIATIAEETGATANQVVLAWLLRSEPAVIPLVAASREEHLRENIGSLKVELTEDQLDRLSQAGNIRQQNPLGQRNLIPGMKEG